MKIIKPKVDYYISIYPKIALAAVLGGDFSQNACTRDGAGSTLKYFSDSK